jgi:DNA-binding transcriptional ArsR family regulator
MVQYSNVLHWHGRQDTVIDLLDERLAKVLSHRLRQRILQRLTDFGVASPSELAEALGERLGNVSYHVRILRELDYLELVRTEPRRGALEHFYQARIGPWLDDEQWARLPASFRRTTLDRTLTQIFEDATTASRAGGFDGPETHVSRVELAVDEEGSVQIAALLAATLEAALQIHAESATRQAQSGPDPRQRSPLSWRSCTSDTPKPTRAAPKRIDQHGLSEKRSASSVRVADRITSRRRRRSEHEHVSASGVTG